MPNPVKSNLAYVPPAGDQLIDPVTGQPSIAWYRAWMAVFDRTGAEKGTNSEDTQAIATQALAVATDAAVHADLAFAMATSAGNIGNNAGAVADEALAIANDALTIANFVRANALYASNNLSDVQSMVTTLVNLNVMAIPVTFSMPGTPAYGTTLSVPIVQRMTVPANLNGVVTYAGTVGTSDQLFVINTLRNGVIIPTGNLTLSHGSKTAHSVEIVGTLQLVVGDILQLVIPATPDATLKDVAITLQLLSIAQ